MTKVTPDIQAYHHIGVIKEDCVIRFANGYSLTIQKDSHISMHVVAVVNPDNTQVVDISPEKDKDHDPKKQ